MFSRASLALLMVLSLPLVVAGCGDDDDDQGASGQAGTSGASGQSGASGAASGASGASGTSSQAGAAGTPGSAGGAAGAGQTGGAGGASAGSGGAAAGGSSAGAAGSAAGTGGAAGQAGGGAGFEEVWGTFVNKGQLPSDPAWVQGHELLVRLGSGDHRQQINAPGAADWSFWLRRVWVTDQRVGQVGFYSSEGTNCYDDKAIALVQPSPVDMTTLTTEACQAETSFEEPAISITLGLQLADDATIPALARIGVVALDEQGKAMIRLTTRLPAVHDSSPAFLLGDTDSAGATRALAYYVDLDDQPGCSAGDRGRRFEPQTLAAGKTQFTFSSSASEGTLSTAATADLCALFDGTHE